MSSSVFLNKWRIRDFTPGEGNFAASAEPAPDDIELTLPGDLYLALTEAGRIAHPFHNNNENACAWIADREWWWVAEFEAPALAPGENLTLACAGLDTFATIWLNGQELGRAENMFRAYEFNLTPALNPAGVNTLAIVFSPATASAPPNQLQPWPGIAGAMTETKRHLIRKAQFGWGWDCAPRLPTIGIWRPVALRRDRIARVAALSFSTRALTAAEAHIRIELLVAYCGAPAPLQARISLHAPDGEQVVARELRLNGPIATLDIVVPDPRIWWTWDLGAQPLYSLTAELHNGADLLDRRTQQAGIRTIALDQSPDPEEPNTNFFCFVLNGVSLFARGACWIPASSFIGALTTQDYTGLIDAARGANMNMLRVWGGGVYEVDAFYRLCNERGLLVWQDFMFACAPYPEDDANFVVNVAQELREQILRLRAHPCLALWCGNNEAQAIYGFLKRFLGLQGELPGALYYNRIMPALTAHLSPEIPYWPGSPTGGPSENSMRAGDEHNWTVWHGIPPVPDADPVGGLDPSPEAVAYTRYAEDRARFVSEFGIQAAPSLSTLQHYLPADALTLDNPLFLGRIKDNPKDKVNAMLLPVTGLPTNLSDYVAYTQITQAEGLKFGIEHFRRRKPHCSGTLIWQFNDCWPGISWSLVDFERTAKASYYATRRAYAPLLASFAHDAEGTELWITNDTPHAACGLAVIELAGFTAAPIWRETVPYEVSAGANRCIWRALPGTVPTHSATHYLHVAADRNQFPANRRFLASFKDLTRPPASPPELRITEIAGRALAIDITAPAYLAFVHIAAPCGWLNITDNFFDLRAGEQRRIIIRGTIDPGTIDIRSW